MTLCQSSRLAVSDLPTSEFQVAHRLHHTCAHLQTAACIVFHDGHTSVRKISASSYFYEKTILFAVCDRLSAHEPVQTPPLCSSCSASLDALPARSLALQHRHAANIGGCTLTPAKKVVASVRRSYQHAQMLSLGAQAKITEL